MSVAAACFVPHWFMTSGQMRGSLPQRGSLSSDGGVMTCANKQAGPTRDGGRRYVC